MVAEVRVLILNAVMRIIIRLSVNVSSSSFSNTCLTNCGTCRNGHNVVVVGTGEGEGGSGGDNE